MDTATEPPGQAASSRPRTQVSEQGDLSRPSASRHVAPRRAWITRLWREVHERVRHNWRLFKNDTPLGQVRRVLAALLLLGGACLLYVLAFATYDRALVLTGRTEVLSMRLDNPAFGTLDFKSAIMRPDQDAPASDHGPVQLDVSSGTRIRFARAGHGPLLLTFSAGQAAAASDMCTTGLRLVGQAALAGVAGPLCEGAVVVVPIVPGDEPLAVGLSGNLVVGEEVSQGAGPRPVLLDTTASLLVKHGGWMFRRACTVELFEHLCDRFVANSLVLAPGNSVRALQPRRSAGC